jgi:hypothetical protein
LFVLNLLDYFPPALDMLAVLLYHIAGIVTQTHPGRRCGNGKYDIGIGFQAVFYREAQQPAHQRIQPGRYRPQFILDPGGVFAGVFPECEVVLGGELVFLAWLSFSVGDNY